MTVANNHFNDFGSEGANFTADVLKKTAIQYFGISFGKYNYSQVHYYSRTQKFVNLFWR